VIVATVIAAIVVARNPAANSAVKPTANISRVLWESSTTAIVSGITADVVVKGAWRINLHNRDWLLTGCCPERRYKRHGPGAQHYAGWIESGAGLFVASSANARASGWRTWRRKGGFMMPRQIYVRSVLNLYAQIPGTCLRARRSDRVLADHFFDQQVPIDIVDAALLLGSARRMFRCGPALGAVRSLHYFRPIVEELLAKPLPREYLSYLRLKVRSSAEALADASDNREL
jgi:hypothetical protein